MIDISLNPLRAKETPYEVLSQAIDKLITEYNFVEVLPYEVAKNIEIMSDLLYVYGIYESKLNEEVSILKMDADRKEAKAVYEERKKWMASFDEKPPAMSYFEALASDRVADIRDEQARLTSTLSAFKTSYESIEQKINAKKKLLDAMLKEGV